MGERAAAARPGHPPTGAQPYILHNALVLTMDEHFRMIAGGAVAVSSGLIVAVGGTAQVLEQFPTWTRYDLGGRVLMPGLINCHSHLPMSLFRGIADDKPFMDWLNHYISPAEAATLNEDFVRTGTALSLWEMLRAGTTTVVDMYLFEEVVAQECARIGMRGVLSQGLLDFPTPQYKSWGESIEGTRAFLKRWQGHPTIIAAVGPHAPYTVSPEHLQECQRLAEEMDAPMVIHLSETRDEVAMISERYGRTPVRHLDQLGCLTRRLVAAHVVWPEEEEIVRLSECGVGVGHCPQSNAKLGCGLAPVVKMLQAGVQVGLGTDGCASNNDLDLWQEMQTANLLQKLSCQNSTIMTARDTLHMVTLGGARAAHVDHLVGSLEVGKRADLIVVRLDRPHHLPVYDPVSQLCYSTKSSDVTQVYIEGQLVMNEGRVPAIDETQLRLAVASEAERVRAALRK